MHRFGWAVVAILLLTANEASAFCRLTTAEPSSGSCSTEGRGLAWDRQCISYTVVARTRENLTLLAIRDTIDHAFEPWLEVECNGRPVPLQLGQTVQLGQCTTAQYNQYGPNANTIMFLNVWEGKDFPPEAFGLTLVWHDPDSGQIFDADMQLNETIAPIALCDHGCDRNVVDLANVVTHEAGHFLGLGHSNVGGATMSANALLGETSKRSLEQDDKDGLCSIYGREPPPLCVADDGDFSPDRGFSSRCGSDDPNRSGCATYLPGHEAQGPGAWLALAGSALALAASRRRRAVR